MRRSQSLHDLKATFAQSKASESRLGLKAIALFKLLKAATLIAAGLGALGLLNSGLNDLALTWLDHLSLNHGRRFASAFAAYITPYLSAATSRRLLEVALGSFLYASIFLVEAGGLWHQKRWAEYLTVFVTASLLPFEILAMTHEQTIPRVLMLGLNLVVIIYLVWRLWARKSLDAGIGNR